MDAVAPTASARALSDPTVGSGPPRAIPVAMTSRHNMAPTVTQNGADVLYTSGLGDCVAIATFHPATGTRTLTHPNAGDVTPAWASTLAGMIDSTTYVIIANGTNQISPQVFRSNDFTRICTAISTAMQARGKSNPRFVMYHTPDLGRPQVSGVRMDTFVMYANGVYGRIGNTTVNVPISRV